MIQLAPFESEWEQREYCALAGCGFEEGSIGFKFFSEEEKLGLVQIHFVGDAAYVLTLCSIDDIISTQSLAGLLEGILEFLKKLGLSSTVFPIQKETDREIAEAAGFDRISETLYVFDFPEGNDMGT